MATRTDDSATEAWGPQRHPNPYVGGRRPERRTEAGRAGRPPPPPNRRRRGERARHGGRLGGGRAQADAEPLHLRRSRVPHRRRPSVMGDYLSLSTYEGESRSSFVRLIEVENQLWLRGCRKTGTTHTCFLCQSSPGPSDRCRSVSWIGEPTI